MENLIGFDVGRAPSLAAEAGLYLHLYGKAEPRRARKMGHLTATGTSVEEAVQRVRAARARLAAGAK